MRYQAAIPPRKLAVLLALRDIHTETGGFAPTVREVAARVGVASPSTVQAHIDWLVAAGLVDRRGARRAITTAGWSALTVERSAA